MVIMVVLIFLSVIKTSPSDGTSCDPNGVILIKHIINQLVYSEIIKNIHVYISIL
jgi:hypothetical protein